MVEETHDMNLKSGEEARNLATLEPIQPNGQLNKSPHFCSFSLNPRFFPQKIGILTQTLHSFKEKVCCGQGQRQR